MPFIINKKYKNKEIDKLMLFSYSLLFAFLISTINIVNIYNILYRIFTNLDGIKFKIFFYCTFTFLIFINYVIINTNNSPDESSKNHTIENKINDQNVNYLIIIVVAIYVSLILIITAFYIHNMNIPSKDPGNIRSYEIIQEEEKYNVIIGYKDNKAITIEGNIRGSSTNKMLIFTSNEYKLQDISDKVIIYETFKNVTPFEGNGSIKGANGSDSKTVDWIIEYVI